ncbi:outer membrane-stress sensor serine endopeptidase DegS [Paraferrimonas sp. SM1919]|uniref:outer membrane-stress sensor serine endopeptidase DegS n=1 Tax=Paraferrimonas sp. SM1919 TaxID=2662263 RepID=UPI0013D0C7EB|nr:outer membrane-stress sensor serine endopeptidase DegS [Paraferrimonas sp. SM1919]
MKLLPIARYLLKAISLGLLVGLVIVAVRSWNNSNHSASINFFGNHDRLSFSDAVRKASPAVVNIYSLSQQNSFSSSRLKGLGSGVIVSSNGYILTNYHVISGADQILVALQDGRSYYCQVIGSDPMTDLTVLKISADHLPFLSVDSNYQSQVGDVVLAIGNPYNLGQTITQGIVSATGRVGMSVTGLQDFLQTDAAINEGNSGGALIDSNGNLVGINTATFRFEFELGSENARQGINFAIPIQLASNIMNKLIKYGRVIRGEIGFNGTNIGPREAQLLRLPDTKGVLVTQVFAQGAAAQAGVEVDDVILQFNGQIINTPSDLKDLIAESVPGTTASLLIYRNGRNIELEITIFEMR